MAVRRFRSATLTAAWLACLALRLRIGFAEAHVPRPADNRRPASVDAYTCGIALGMLSGAMHGLAMALRKKGGAVSTRYWLDCSWWAGIICDALAGVSFMVSVSFVPAIVLLPVVAVCQICTGYVLGVTCFRESPSRRRDLGLICAVSGVVILGGHGHAEAAPGVITSFLSLFTHCTRTWFLSANVAIICTIWATYLSKDHAMQYVLLAAYSDGLQFLSTRAISSTLLAGETIWNPCLLLILVSKGVFIISWLHFQQSALTASLSQVAAAYPLVGGLMPCILGATFFGDSLEFDLGLIVALLATILGMVLLSTREKLGVQQETLHECLL